VEDDEILWSDEAFLLLLSIEKIENLEKTTLHQKSHTFPTLFMSILFFVYQVGTCFSYSL